MQIFVLTKNSTTKNFIMKKFLIIICLGLFSGAGHSQVSGAVALATLNELDASVSKQIQSIDNLATNAIGNTGNMLLSVSARLRKDINETIGNTDRMLREHELTIYNQLINLQSDFNKAIKGNLELLNDIVTRATETMDNFIVKKTEPVVYSYVTPSFIKKHTGDYTAKIKGKNFNRSEDILLSINGKNLKPVQKNYQELIFVIDSAQINAVTPNASFANAELHFKWRKGLFRKKMKTNEPFIIPVYPLEIGNVTVFYEQALPERKYTDLITYSCDCHTGSSDWQGNPRHGTTAFNILPTSGRTIDPASLSNVDFHRRYNGGRYFDHVTDQQIQGRLTCESDHRPYGGGGSSSLKFGYKEYEIIYPVHKNQTPIKEITTVNPVLFDLPDAVDNKRPNINYVRINTFDNKEIILTPNAPDKLFELRLNPATYDVTVAWKN
jgi:hypothetical protein